LAILIALLAAGCGTGGELGHSASPGGPGRTPTTQIPSASAASPPTLAPAPPTSETPAPTHTLISPGTVTFADAGYTVRLSPGERLNVYLSNRYEAWDRPQANGEAVQRIAASGGYPSRRSARATFLAVMDGTATIISRTDHPCLHAHPPCAVMQRIWLVRVVVSG
jgi:hypothetical protein